MLLNFGLLSGVRPWYDTTRSAMDTETNLKIARGIYKMFEFEKKKLPDGRKSFCCW